MFYTAADVCFSEEITALYQAVTDSHEDYRVSQKTIWQANNAFKRGHLASLKRYHPTEIFF